MVARETIYRVGPNCESPRGLCPQELCTAPVVVPLRAPDRNLLAFSLKMVSLDAVDMTDGYQQLPNLSAALVLMAQNSRTRCLKSFIIYLTRCYETMYKANRIEISNLCVTLFWRYRYR